MPDLFGGCGSHGFSGGGGFSPAQVEGGKGEQPAQAPGCSKGKFLEFSVLRMAFTWHMAVVKTVVVDPTLGDW